MMDRILAISAICFGITACIRIFQGDYNGGAAWVATTVVVLIYVKMQGGD